ncbi:MAG: cell division protein FtsZ, partial [Oscillospiraceae bacterium]|nr:cell division protein FtsZ [Oscillospiraceae bacterium]
HPDANIIFGATFDEDMDDEIRVTVIATGFDDHPANIYGKAEERKAAAEEDTAGLFTAATSERERAENMGSVPSPMAPSATSDGDDEDDPFDTIFKIFNSK